MTTNSTPSVTQADVDAFGAVTDCLKTASELRAKGGCDQVEQAIFWENKAKQIVARHRTQAEAASAATIAELVEHLELLANRERQYRAMHDLKGDGSHEAGRAWDLMRRAGDQARALLAKVKAQAGTAA